MPVKDILRSKFTWHINQLTNNEKHEILVWKVLIFLYFFIISALLYFAKYMYNYNNVIFFTC